MNCNDELACKLTSKAFQERKATVLSDLKSQVIDKKELSNGFAFYFSGEDRMIDQLSDFIKTERECCNFFTFGLTIKDASRKIRLKLTGPQGAKKFISNEIGW